MVIEWKAHLDIPFLHFASSPHHHQTTKPSNKKTSDQHKKETKQITKQHHQPSQPTHSHNTSPFTPPHLLPFFPPLTGPPTLLPAPTATPRNSLSPFSTPQAAQSVSILTVAQISPPEQARCTKAADGQKAANTVLVWPQGWVWA